MFMSIYLLSTKHVNLGCLFISMNIYVFQNSTSSFENHVEPDQLASDQDPHFFIPMIICINSEISLLVLDLHEIGSSCSMRESSKFPKSWTLEIQILKLTPCIQKMSNVNWRLSADENKL